MNKKGLSQLKKLYQERFNYLCEKFLKNHNSQAYLRKQTHLVDQLLISLWQSLPISKDIVLVAVGGYGRKELFPFSDVDILIVFEKEIAVNNQEAISQFVTNCWDLGFKIGHSVRNIKQTKQEFNADISTATNLIESRFLIGSSVIFNKMNRTINTSLSIKKFYKLKLQEQENRHRKFRDSAYQLEPNIKESPGGLRDLHMIRWLSISQGKGRTFKEMLENNLIDKVEFNKIQLHETKITKRRILLHILAKRTEDRLVFDVQNKLAAKLGFKNTKNKKSSEIVMKSYYKSVNYITLFNEIIIKRLDPNIKNKTKIKHPLPLYIYNDLIELDKKNITKIKPYILDVFLLFQHYKKVKGFGPNLLGALDTLSAKIDKKYRSDSNNQKKFLDIFKSNYKVSRSLRLLNKCNILGKFIPAFGKIVAQMQHDLFHTYTVDEHTLNVIEKKNLSELSNSELLPSELGGIPTDISTSSEIVLHSTCVYDKALILAESTQCSPNYGPGNLGYCSGNITSISVPACSDHGVAYYTPSSNQRAIPGGVSIGTTLVPPSMGGSGSGTLGWLAYDNTDDKIVGVTNNHVIGYNFASAGLNADPINYPGIDCGSAAGATANGGLQGANWSTGYVTQQPSYPDNGNSSAGVQMGSVKRFHPLCYNYTQNKVDAALIELTEEPTTTILGLAWGPYQHATTAEVNGLVGSYVYKVGRSSGNILSVSYPDVVIITVNAANIKLGNPNFMYDQQILFKSAGDGDPSPGVGGDSGAAILCCVGGALKIVGINFAGNYPRYMCCGASSGDINSIWPNGFIGIANRIDEVESKLNISSWDGSLVVAPTSSNYIKVNDKCYYNAGSTTRPIQHTIDASYTDCASCNSSI